MLSRSTWLLSVNLDSNASETQKVALNRISGEDSRKSKFMQYFELSFAYTFEKKKKVVGESRAKSKKDKL